VLLILQNSQGNLTSGENIGDSGLIHSWRAWKSHINATTDFLLPGLEDFTREQLFFISFAHIWATRSSPSADVLQVRTDPHSPAIYRVHGTLSNIPDFAKTFNCPANSKV
jgi:endothelin-converting enzyme